MCLVHSHGNSPWEDGQALPGKVLPGTRVLRATLQAEGTLVPLLRMLVKK